MSISPTGGGPYRESRETGEEGGEGEVGGPYLYTLLWEGEGASSRLKLLSV